MGQNKCYLLCENIALLLLRITLFIFLIIIVFVIDNSWIKAVAISALVVIVMFKGLNFFEVPNILKAAGPIDWDSRGKTDSFSVTTPDKEKEQWMEIDDEKTIKTEFFNEENKLK